MATNRCTLLQATHIQGSDIGTFCDVMCRTPEKNTSFRWTNKPCLEGARTAEERSCDDWVIGQVDQFTKFCETDTACCGSLWVCNKKHKLCENKVMSASRAVASVLFKFLGIADEKWSLREKLLVPAMKKMRSMLEKNILQRERV